MFILMNDKSNITVLRKTPELSPIVYYKTYLKTLLQDLLQNFNIVIQTGQILRKL